MTTNISYKRKKAFFLTHLAVLCAQAILALAQLLRAPSEPENAFILGYSMEKIFLLSVPLGILVVGAALILYLRSNRFRLQRLNASLDRIIKSRIVNLANILCAAVVLICAYLLAALMAESFFILAPHYETYLVGTVFERTRYYLQQLKPMMYLAIGLCVQVMIFFLGVRADLRTWKKRLRGQGIYTLVWVYGLFLILWGFLNWGSMNFEQDLSGYSWHPLGAPVSDRDVFLTFLIGLVLIGIAAAGNALGIGKKRMPSAEKDRRSQYVDITIGLLIWVTAAAVWLSLPIEPNWFIAEPAYPNFEFYPSSDALKYDISAQSMLVGEDLLFYGTMMHKPMYSAFLAFLHFLAGTGFYNVSMLQSAVFAVFPVLVYLLGKRLHSRLAGITISLLVIFREANAIISASEITVSHTRQLMTDTPAAIGILIIISIVYTWLQKPNKYYWLPVVIGGLVAVLMQVRNELLLLLPVVLIFQLVIYFRNPRYWIRTSVFMVVGFSMIFTLWQIRGMYFSGESFLNASRVNAVIRQGQVRPPELDLEPVEQPGGRLPKIFSHLIHNQQQAVLIFPNAFRAVDSLINYSEHENSNLFWRDCCSTENYIDRLHMFWEWQKWDGFVPHQSAFSILATLFFISLGIVKSTKKSGVRALFPLSVVYAFYLLLSVFLMSGGRRVQIIDWIWIVYYGIGLAQFSAWVFYFLFSSRAPEWLVGRQDKAVTHEDFAAPDHSRLAWKPVIAAGLVVLLFGAIVPLIELVIPAQFSESTRQDRTNAVLRLENGGVLSKFLENGGAVWEGRAFYPQYIEEAKIERSLRDGYPDEFGYLRFSLAGPNSLEIILPRHERGEFSLPNSSDVLVFGCPSLYFFEALAVYVVEEQAMIFRDPFPEKLICPVSRD